MPRSARPDLPSAKPAEAVNAARHKCGEAKPADAGASA
jgi:hypothetical protein